MLTFYLINLFQKHLKMEIMHNWHNYIVTLSNSPNQRYSPAFTLLGKLNYEYESKVRYAYSLRLLAQHFLCM